MLKGPSVALFITGAERRNFRAGLFYKMGGKWEKIGILFNY